MNFKILTTIGAIGSGLAALFGGWDTSLQTLLLFMVIDWVTGGILLPVVFKTSYFRDAVCIAFIANEALSILENAGLMGMPLPEALKKAISVLEQKGKEAFEKE